MILEIYNQGFKFYFYINGELYDTLNLFKKPNWFLKWYEDSQITELRECGTLYLVFNFKVDELREINEPPGLGASRVSQKERT
jgi:hypothetical protein